MNFEELNEFIKDMNKLRKKYRSLDEDLEVVRKVLRVEPNERPPFSFRISDLGFGFHPG